MSERIEIAAKAINRVDEEREHMLPWNAQSDEAKHLYRGEAEAAIDAYRTLTAEQWEAERETVARAIFAPMKTTRPLLDYEFPAASEYTRSTCYRHADAAMSALGFRRADLVAAS